LKTLETTNDLGIANSSARVLPEGTVVLSRTASVGFVAIMGRPMATSQDFVNWVCEPGLEPLFLMYLLRASRVAIRGLSSGAIHKTVYVPTVKAFQVCAPDMAEQKRIAGEVGNQLTTLAAVQTRTENEAAEIDRLPAAVLRHAFHGR
jgi:type I restriction enzyme S subunit